MRDAVTDRQEGRSDPAMERLDIGDESVPFLQDMEKRITKVGLPGHITREH